MFFNGNNKVLNDQALQALDLLRLAVAKWLEPLNPAPAFGQIVLEFKPKEDYMNMMFMISFYPSLRVRIRARLREVAYGEWSGNVVFFESRRLPSNGDRHSIPANTMEILFEKRPCSEVWEIAKCDFAKPVDQDLLLEKIREAEARRVEFITSRTMTPPQR